VNYDGYISINLSSCNLGTGPTPADRYSLTSVAMHEIDEVLGSASALTGFANGTTAPTTPAPEDLFRFNYSGARRFNTSATESTFFSLDGVNRLVRFNQDDRGDYSDWWSPGGHIPRVQDAFGTQGADPTMNVEWTMLDAIGWSYASPAVWVDFFYTGLIEAGIYQFPYRTLAHAVSAVATGGVIIIDHGGNTVERPTLTKPLTLTSIKGVANVGQ